MVEILNRDVMLKISLHEPFSLVIESPSSFPIMEIPRLGEYALERKVRLSRQRRFPPRESLRQ